MKPAYSRDFICPHCQKEIQLSSQSTHSMAFCPHCSKEILIANLETKLHDRKINEEEKDRPPISLIKGEYKLFEELGKGGMGTVYLGEQLSLNRLIAVKILPPLLAMEEQFIQRFQREAKTMGALDHPNIVKVLDQGVEQSLYYFIMEYVEGKSLQDILDQEDLTWSEQCRILIETCKGLGYAHKQGVIHRDIKPGNILIRKDGQVKISDFGLVRLVSGSSISGSHSLPNLTATNMVMGTLRYMAPEQKNASKNIDHRADLFSLGVMAYEMWTGEEPSGRFALPSKINPKYNEKMDMWIDKSLQSNPRYRFKDAFEMEKILQEIMTEQDRATTIKNPQEEKEPSQKFLMKILMGSQLGCSVAITVSLAVLLMLPQFGNLFKSSMGERKTAKMDKNMHFPRDFQKDRNKIRAKKDRTFGKKKNFSSIPEPRKIEGNWKSGSKPLENQQQKRHYFTLKNQLFALVQPSFKGTKRKKRIGSSNKPLSRILKNPLLKGWLHKSQKKRWFFSKLSPKMQSAIYLKLGQVFEKRAQNFPEALRCYNFAIEKTPKDPKAYYFKAFLLGIQGDVQGCARNYFLGLERDPEKKIYNQLLLEQGQKTK